MLFVMNWKTFYGYALVYTGLGAVFGWAAAKWVEAYNEARDAGVVA